MILQRDSQTPLRTTGQMLRDTGEHEAFTIERPWRGNEEDVSCIPAGSYTCALVFSPHHGFAVFEVQNVPNRTHCQIHAANLASQLSGCVALGESRGTLNGQDAVMASQSAVDTFMAARGVAEYRDLTTQALTDAWIAAHEDVSFPLTVIDPA